MTLTTIVMTRSVGFMLVLLLALAGRSSASMVVPLGTEEHLRLADAVCRGTVVGTECFKDPASGHIFTRTRVRVDEALKGRFPVAVSLAHRGGCVGHEGDHNGLNPQFDVGDERLLFLARRPDGTLFALQGAASAIKLARDSNGLKPLHDALLRAYAPKPSRWPEPALTSVIKRHPALRLSIQPAPAPKPVPRPTACWSMGLAWPRAS